MEDELYLIVDPPKVFQKADKVDCKGCPWAWKENCIKPDNAPCRAKTAVPA
jgi:hypothetical protein